MIDEFTGTKHASTFQSHGIVVVPGDETMFDVPKAMLDPYRPARGKAGALNFAVRLLHARGILNFAGGQSNGNDRRSLFAIFDARHMPHEKFWWWVLPAFFQRKQDNQRADVRHDVSFVQVPQRFAKLQNSKDFLDVTNGMGFNLINQMRNNVGAVTSCGTNAVWLLPSAKDLPHIDANKNGTDEKRWFDSTYYEELTKIEDTASSHRCLFEGKYSVYVNPEADSKLSGAKDLDLQHPAVIGVAKLGSEYLAAVERWCEGAVQLFWITLFREKRSTWVWIIACFCFSLFAFLMVTSIFPIQLLCGIGGILREPFCEPVALWLCDRNIRLFRDSSAMLIIGITPFCYWIEGMIWWSLILLFSSIFFGVFTKCSLSKALRFVVMYDNLTYWTNCSAALFWFALNVWLVCGQKSPFEYQIFDFMLWFLILRLISWGLLYTAKSAGNCDEMNIWRSQQAYICGAPLQVYAFFQGTKAAWDIIRKDVDKSWWRDPKENVSKISKTWTAMLVLLFPLGFIYLLICMFVLGHYEMSQVFALIMALVLGSLAISPGLYIWDLMGPKWEKAIRCFQNCCCCARVSRANRSGVFTSALRLLNELLVPLLLVAWFSPDIFQNQVCKLLDLVGLEQAIWFCSSTR